MILKSQGSVSSSGSGSGRSMNGGKSVKPLSAWTRMRCSRSRMVVTAIASCRSTFCAITDTRSKTSRTSSTPDRAARRSSSITRLSARSRSAAARARLVRHPLVLDHQRHVLGDPSRDVDVRFAIGRHRRRAELQRAADAAIEPEREAQRRPQAGLRRRPVALGRIGQQVVVQRELKVLVEDRPRNWSRTPPGCSRAGCRRARRRGPARDRPRESESSRRRGAAPIARSRTIDERRRERRARRQSPAASVRPHRGAPGARAGRPAVPAREAPWPDA